MKKPDCIQRYTQFDIFLGMKTIFAVVFIDILSGFKLASFLQDGAMFTPTGNPYWFLALAFMIPLAIAGIRAAGKFNYFGELVSLSFRFGLAIIPVLFWMSGVRNYAFFAVVGPIAFMTAYWLYNTVYNHIYFSINKSELDLAAENVFNESKRFYSDEKQTGLVKNQNQDQEPAAPDIMYHTVQPSLKFADVVGMMELKSKLLRAGKNVQTHSQDDDRNGIMLMGDPGNGKTMFAEALAGELEIPFLKVSFGDLASKWVNQTTEQIVKVFADAKAQAPCMLFIDEIDSIIRDRANMGGGAAEKFDAVNVALTELVNIRNSGVIIIGATNNPDLLDPAAFRDGRFDYKIEVTSPDLAARIAIMKQTFTRAKGFLINVDESGLLEAVKRWEGFSAARITGVAKEAVSIVRASGCQVDFQLLTSALRNVQGRAGKLPSTALTVAQLAQPKEVLDVIAALALRMEKIQEIEAFGGKVPTGVLFHGLAGSGKTSAAMALAKTANWGFLSVAGADLVRDPSLIDSIFLQAADLRPCIIFVDEADGLLADRTYSQFAEITNKFLIAMDGAGGKASDVMVVAATNYPEKMDPAALRGGRFTEKIEFKPLDTNEILRQLKKWRAGLKLPVVDTVTDDLLLAKLNGLAIANVQAVLQQVVTDVATRKVQGGGQLILLSDIESALIRVLK